ncbi:unnamed protein product [Phaedon cochleariae]|uniref:Odorant receptor n=1 Tax=Phaedon cochleariae TaxID=80249 RepID=A0A9N9SG66_PHACE|nr:unnamed protein product [Phaedon cochleariae]
MLIFSKSENTMRDDMFLEMVHPSGFLLYINHDKLKLFSHSMVLYMQILNVWSIYYLSNNFDLFLQYNSLLLAQHFGLSSAVYLTISYHHIIQFKNRVKAVLWPLDFCGKRTHDKLLKQIRLLKYEFIIIIFCTIGGHALFMPIVGDESDIFIEIRLIDEVFGKDVRSKVLSSVFYIGIVFLGISIGGVVNLFVYFSVHIETQFHLLNLKVENISGGLERIEEEDRFQRILGSRLKFCIARHITLLKLFYSMETIHNNWPVLIFSLTGVLMIVSEIYLLLAGISSRSNIRLMLAMVTTGYIAFLFVFHGQKLENEYLRLHHAAQNCSWHRWNKQNIFYLRMLLMNSSKPIKITSFHMVDLDYTLPVKVREPNNFVSFQSTFYIKNVPQGVTD